VARGVANDAGSSAVPSSGNAAIQQVFVDGKPCAEAMKDAGR